MWAQLIRMRLKPGREGDLEKVWAGLRATEQPGSGLVRSTSMHDQTDHLSVYTLVVFDSEDAARARENDPRRQEGLAEIRALMGEIFDGPPEFVDLIIDDDHTG
jgi:hypothetical protein